mmetsp:Transcript_3736/g.4188  ORF Transcript_3736/g.4188 Transcript_3736/m.4188 type:complete len:155 (+) Transcript_3736:51-515(+)
MENQESDQGKLPSVQRCWTRFISEFTIQNLTFSQKKKGVGNINWRVHLGHDGERCIGSYSLYFAIRIILFGFVFSVLVTSLVRDWEEGKWFIYLTHWGLLLETVYFALAVWTSYKSKRVKHSNSVADSNIDNRIPLYAQLTWLTWDITLPPNTT